MKYRIMPLAIAMLGFMAPSAMPSTGASHAITMQFQHANAAFDRAKTKEDFMKVALQYEALTRKVHSSMLYYNLGNSYFRAGAIGRAILAYRRSLVLDPGNQQTIHNINKARRIRKDQLEPEKAATLLSELAFWHHMFSKREKFWWAWAGFMLGWALFTLHLVRPYPSLKTLACCGFLLTITMACSMTLQSRQASRRPSGVILAAQVQARTGNGGQYESAFKEPLHAGVEFEMLETRGMWWRIRINRELECWIPADSAEIVEGDQAKRD